MSVRRITGGTVIAAALFLLIGRWTATLYADYHWYLALGAGEVWRARVLATALLVGGSFAIAAVFAFANLYAVRQSVVSLVLPRRIGNIEIGEEVPGHYLIAVVAALSVVLGIVLALPAEHWHEALLAKIGKPFGELDPYFNADLGFFVYWLPFEAALHAWAVIVLAVVCALVVTLYALTPSLRWDRGSLYVSAYVRRHFTMLGAVLLLMLAWSYRLGMYRLLSSGSGTGGLFTNVDHRISVPATLLLSVVTMCAALVVAWSGWTGQMRIAFSAVTAVLLLSFLARTVAPLVVRRSVDPRDRRKQELPYIGTRLTYTRRAFAVDRIHPDSLGAGFATRADAATRLAIWDGGALTRAAERTRRVRVFGDGPAWTEGPAGITAAIVDRGAESERDPRDVWAVSRYDAASADDRGHPVHVGATGNADEFLAGEPIVYDSAPSYSVLSDSLQQIAGVEMVSTRSRLMHAWSLQNFRLLFGEVPANRPVMVRHRDVRARVQALAPFFVEGGEVVPLIADDSLYWVIELYASSATYPLSQRFTILGEDRGYLQHAATALVHAASGRVRFITDAAPDPVTLSWMSQFPGVFRSQGATRSVIAVLPPMTDLARSQALAFAVAGFLFDSVETRHLASSDGADSSSREPTHAAIPLLTGVSALWTLLDSTERVRGVIAASGGSSRGTSWIPVTSDGQRWGAVVDRLHAADTLLHETGAARAPLRVVPVSGRPMYVQPSFVNRLGAVPTLSHVSTLMSDTVRVGVTLAAAVGAPPPIRGNESAAAPTARGRADSLYRAMRDALSRGDWNAFGRAFDALGATLRSLPR
ncbi:MAG TPA: UPF0182 family protein [Gemmatimonadaceae bacterium]